MISGELTFRPCRLGTAGVRREFVGCFRACAEMHMSQEIPMAGLFGEKLHANYVCLG
jgi:hypothetical protein